MERFVYIEQRFNGVYGSIIAYDIPAKKVSGYIYLETYDHEIQSVLTKLKLLLEENKPVTIILQYATITYDTKILHIDYDCIRHPVSNSVDFTYDVNLHKPELLKWYHTLLKKNTPELAPERYKYTFNKFKWWTAAKSMLKKEHVTQKVTFTMSDDVNFSYIIRKWLFWYNRPYDYVLEIFVGVPLRDKLNMHYIGGVTEKINVLQLLIGLELFMRGNPVLLQLDPGKIQFSNNTLSCTGSHHDPNTVTTFTYVPTRHKQVFEHLYNDVCKYVLGTKIYKQQCKKLLTAAQVRQKIHAIVGNNPKITHEHILNHF